MLTTGIKHGTLRLDGGAFLMGSEDALAYRVPPSCVIGGCERRGADAAARRSIDEQPH